MRPGQIVTVNWRDAASSSGEPNKTRPGIVVGAPRFYEHLPFELVVPLTASRGLAMEDASVRIEPTSANGCTKPSYALSWNVQCVPHVRMAETPSSITEAELQRIRTQISACVER